MTTTINAQATAGLLTTADGSGIVKLQSNGVTTNSLAWLNFTGATGAVNTSYNISSVTRFSSGGYTANFTNIMASASYVAVASSTGLSASYPYTFMTIFSNFSGYTAPTTSAFSMIFVASNGGASWTGGDPTTVTATVFGN